MLPALRASAVMCDTGGFCAFIVTPSAPVHVVYLLSVWPTADHLLVRIESSTTEEHVRVPLHGGQHRAENRSRGQESVRDAIETGVCTHPHHGLMKPDGSGRNVPHVRWNGPPGLSVNPLSLL